jgi:hypothetical protein
MNQPRKWRPSPAIVVAMVALVAALAGVAVAAGPMVTKRSVSKSEVRRIANAQIRKRFPAFALVKKNGDVIASRSFGITNANVNKGLAPPYYCFSGLKFQFKGVQVTPAYDMQGTDWGAVAASRSEQELFECASSAQVEVETSSGDALAARGFYIQFYR